MLLGQLEMAARRMDVRALARPVELRKGAARMIADLVVHPSVLLQARLNVLDINQDRLSYWLI